MIITMFIRMILCLSPILVLVGCSTDTKIERIDGSKISQSELTYKIESLIDSANVSGLAISIINRNKVVYKNAFGYSNIETKDSLATSTIFYGASLSKAVFGYLVAQLADEEIIDLDIPLQDYFDVQIPDISFEKEWKGYGDLTDDNRYKQITARMCLSHTTGFPNWRWLSKNGEFYPEGRLHFFFDPGTRYSYSGEGINLLQFVIERITNKGLEELATERIFGPLNMEMTSYVWQKRFENNYCNGHTINQEVIPKDTEDEAGAAGSMETNLDDYSEFVQHILNQASNKSEVTQLLFEPGIQIKSKAQFGPEAWEDTGEYDSIELGYGLGWGLLKSPFGVGAFKEGHGEGFQHYSIIFPEKQIGIIIMTNSDNGESVFKELLDIAIGDKYTPWKWENYIPYDHSKI